MTGCADLMDLHQENVPVAIHVDSGEVLGVTAGVAFSPVVV